MSSHAGCVQHSRPSGAVDLYASFQVYVRQGGSGWAGPGKAIQKLETGEAGLLFYLLIGKLDKTITCTEVLNTI
jgi:hypothetical protein